MRRTLIALLMVAGMAATTAVQASISGLIWEGTDGYGSLTEAHSWLTSNPNGDVSFTVNTPINFDSRGASDSTYYTIGSFLGTGGAAIVTGNSHADDSLNNTLFYMTGQVTMENGKTYSVAHDDGLQLLVGSTMLVDAAGPTSPTVTLYTWTGASGTYSFELAYGEGWGPPGVLKIDLPLETVVPEPTTVLAGLLLVLPFGASAVRVLRKKLSA